MQKCKRCIHPMHFVSNTKLLPTRLLDCSLDRKPCRTIIDCVNKYHHHCIHCWTKAFLILIYDADLYKNTLKSCLDNRLDAPGSNRSISMVQASGKFISATLRPTDNAGLTRKTTRIFPKTKKLGNTTEYS